MTFSVFQIVLAIIFMISGSINTIAAKWMDMTMAKSKDGIIRKFEHPFLQADILFLGEILCMIIFLIIYYTLKRRQDGSVEENTITKGSRTFNPLILWPASLFDMIGTCLMFFGLTMTTASSAQMLRGSVIIFTALLSLCILKRRIKIYEWIGIVLIVIAMVIIGLADMLNNNVETAEKEEQIIGDILTIIATFINACQFVYEEVFVVRLDIPPLQTVGWEGVFGFIVMTILLFPLYFIPLPSKLHGQTPLNNLEDALDAFVQVGNRPLLLLPIFLFLFSIAFYNFSGISLTKELNATTRMVLDSVRTLIVWVVSLALSWQDFHYLQVRFSHIYFVSFAN